MQNKLDCKNCKKDILLNELQVENGILKKELEEQSEVIKKLRQKQKK